MTTLFNYDAIRDWIPYLVKGLGVTLFIAFVAAIFGLIVGILVVVSHKSKVTAWLSFMYIDLFRGTPLLLQLAIIYFAVPQLVTRIFNGFFQMDVNITIAALVAACIAFSLNSGAYISEIIRSGINSVDPGELEAARALGVSKFHTFKDIVLPIAFKNSFPALNNEFITLVKESSIVSILGIQDLMRRQQIISSQTYMFFEPLIIVGLIYYLVIKVLSIAGRQVERRLAND
jgi:polar amino acid transport system permease protein